MIGPLAIVIGLLGIWAVATGKAKNVLDAVTSSGFSTSLDNALGNLNLSSPAGASGAGGGHSSSGSAGVDSGSHQGIDPATGLIVTIDKPYSDMTDAEKDAANNYAHQYPNGM